MSEPVFDLAELRKVGMIQQKQKEYFALRLHAVIGEFTSAQMTKVAEVAEKFGKSRIHLTTRQGIEIHSVHYSLLEAARIELESAGITMGACGPRVRIITGCPGEATCRWGIIDTKEVADELDRRYFRQDTPYKFKLAVTGCPHNCAKAHENDVGVMGGLEPTWEESICSDCGLCVNVCPTAAIERVDGRYVVNPAKCINCSICTANCPTEAWVAERSGYVLWIGGTVGKTPRLATRVPGLIESRETLVTFIDRAIEFYRANGRKKERFGHTIDRIGVERTIEEITNGKSDQKEYRSSWGHVPHELREDEARLGGA